MSLALPFIFATLVVSLNQPSLNTPPATKPTLSQSAHSNAALRRATLTQPTFPDSTHCSGAAKFLRDDRKMIAEVEADTIDDWRSGRKVPGCRVTAAGITDIGVQREALRFYESVRSAGWARTPDPRDAPNEAALRFRLHQSDCLFHVNAQALLNTDAEMRVNDALDAGAAQQRYHVFVMCMPIMPARPR